VHHTGPAPRPVPGRTGSLRTCPSRAAPGGRSPRMPASNRDRRPRDTVR
jgi:hypothetical protein